MPPLRILTWHVHGNYLYYLSQSGCEFYLPLKRDGTPGYGGRGNTFPFGANVHELPAEDVRRQPFDCVLFQSRANYLQDQYEILSEQQRRLPRIYVEHDPPLDHPTDAHHPVADPNILLVHVTPFNALMWESGATPTRVIDHGVLLPEGVRYGGGLPRGLTAVNNLGRRGRRVGPDIFTRVREQVPLDLVGMNAEDLGGIGEIHPLQLPEFESHYRFFFNPSRYTSLNLAVCEAMMLGMPVVGLATTEMATAVENGASGYVDTDVERLVPRMHDLLADPDEARRLGENARRYAEERFNIRRFVRDWEAAFTDVAGRPAAEKVASLAAARSTDEPAIERVSSLIAARSEGTR